MSPFVLPMLLYLVLVFVTCDLCTCVAMMDVCEFMGNCRCSLVLYSVGSGVNSGHAVLSGLSM